MNTKLWRGRLRPAATCFTVLAAVHAGQLEAAHLEEVLIVDRRAQSERFQDIGHNAVAATSADASDLISKVPGGGRNFNGPLSGQMQYRGMFGPRMNVLVDGLRVVPAGPNWMDPPLHYLPMALTDKFRVFQGIAPVSAGTGIGGHVQATTKRSVFSDTKKPIFSGDLTLKGHSADDGYNVGGLFGVANDTWRGHVLLSRDEGDDREAGDGTVAATEYERDFYGIGVGWQHQNHEVFFDYQHVDTGHSGTPSLPLDIAFFDADHFDFGYRGEFGELVVDATISVGDVDHAMNNFSLRTTPDFSSLPLAPFIGDDRRFVDTKSNSVGFTFGVKLPVMGGRLQIGADGLFADHDATVFDPDVTPFFINNFNNAEYDTVSGFAEWSGMLWTRLESRIGVRYTNVSTAAGAVDAQPAQFADMNPMLCTSGMMPPPPPCAVRALRNSFNAGDRDESDHNIDVVANFRYGLNDNVDLLLSAGRKTRSPSYIERYLWIPLEINAGLGDGNNYIGDPGLDPEKAWEVEGGFDLRNEKAYFTPRGYYRSIDDFIQGAPIAMSPATMPIIGVSGRANGDPTPLIFANVDAEVYGFDAGFGWRFTDRFRVDGNVTYTRGKRRDIDDNLYRITPPTLRMTFSYQRPKWSIGLESVMVARATHISQVITNDPANANNSNRETPGYVIANLAGSVQLPFGDTRLVVGVENLLDHHYTDHLSGFNRVIGSDVPIGRRLPGSGINGFATLTTRW